MKTGTASWNYSQKIVKFLESTRNKTYTIIGFTFIALILFGAFAIRPTIGTIFKLQSKVENGKEIESVMTEKLETLAVLQNSKRNNQKKIDVLLENLSTEKNIESIIASIQLIAEEYDLDVLAMTPETNSSLTNRFTESGLLTDLSEYGMDIELEGDKKDFQEFVKHLENLPRILYITNLGYTQSEEIETTSFNLKFYFFTLKNVESNY